MTTHFTLQFLEALYPDPVTEAGGRLVLWTRRYRARTSRSHWFESLSRAVEVAGSLRQTEHVYFGVALQDGDRALEIARAKRPKATLRNVRGCEKSAVALPAIYADLDVAGPGHSSDLLPPDRDAALALLDAVPHRPSIIVRTGGGFHVYWLFKELWILDSEAERAAAKSLLLRLHRALNNEARRFGWSVDHTADLARVLRLPGTFNHKTSSKQLVAVEELHPDRRYEASHFDVLPGPRDLPESSSFSASGKRYQEPEEYETPADFERVRRGCPWIYHCDLDREKLSEPEWYAMLSIAGRCTGPGGESGRELAHRLSRGYPGYDPMETDQKLDHALRDTGPRSCRHVAFELGLFDEYCDRCVHFGRIASPIKLGRPDPPPVPHPDPHPQPLSQPTLHSHPGEGSSRPDPDEFPRREGSSAPEGRQRIARGGDPGSAMDPLPDPHPQPLSQPGAPQPTLHSHPGEGSSCPDRPRILITTRELYVNQQALEALVDSVPNLYERAGTLVQVVEVDDDRPGGRTYRQAVARPVAEARLRELLAAACDFRSRRRTSRGAVEVPVHPPVWVVRAVQHRGVWPRLPILTGVVECPVLRRDGSILQEPGYDRVSGLYYAAASRGGRMEPVPSSPTAAQVDAAKALLEEVVCDFPFQRPIHLAGWLSSLLTPLARFAFDGPSPLNLIDANVRGAGKSLLADAVTKILTGREAARMPYTRDEDEFRKSITSLALEGSQTVLLDNVRGTFGSASLECVLTTSIWRDRLLGMNVKATLPLQITWYVTGNNIALLGDIPRRCVHIRLESPEERPETRSGFRHPRLLRWIGEERRRLLPAALTLLRAFVDAGRPDQDLSSWGSFEEWSDLVRKTVVWLGYPDPAETCSELEETSEWTAERAFVVAFAEVFGHQGATAREILQRAADPPDGDQDLRSAVEDLFPRLKVGELPTPVRLGHKLRSLRGRVFEGTAIQQGARQKGGMVWIVERSPES